MSEDKFSNISNTNIVAPLASGEPVPATSASITETSAAATDLPLMRYKMIQELMAQLSTMQGRLPPEIDKKLQAFLQQLNVEQPPSQDTLNDKLAIPPERNPSPSPQLSDQPVLRQLSNLLSQQPIATLPTAITSDISSKVVTPDSIFSTLVQLIQRQPAAWMPNSPLGKSMINWLVQSQLALNPEYWQNLPRQSRNQLIQFGTLPPENASTTPTQKQFIQQFTSLLFNLLTQKKDLPPSDLPSKAPVNNNPSQFHELTTTSYIQTDTSNIKNNISFDVALKEFIQTLPSTTILLPPQIKNMLQQIRSLFQQEQTNNFDKNTRSPVDISTARIQIQSMPELTSVNKIQPPSTAIFPTNNVTLPAAAIAPANNVPSPAAAIVPANNVTLPAAAIEPANNIPSPAAAIVPANNVPSPAAAIAPATNIPSPAAAIAPANNVPSHTAAIVPANNVTSPAAAIALATNIPSPAAAIAPANNVPSTAAAIVPANNVTSPAAAIVPANNVTSPAAAIVPANNVTSPAAAIALATNIPSPAAAIVPANNVPSPAAAIVPANNVTLPAAEPYIVNENEPSTLSRYIRTLYSTHSIVDNNLITNSKSSLEKLLSQAIQSYPLSIEKIQQAINEASFFNTQHEQDINKADTTSQIIELKINTLLNQLAIQLSVPKIMQSPELLAQVKNSLNQQIWLPQTKNEWLQHKDVLDSIQSNIFQLMQTITKTEATSKSISSNTINTALNPSPTNEINAIEAINKNIKGTNSVALQQLLTSLRQLDPTTEKLPESLISKSNSLLEQFNSPLLTGDNIRNWMQFLLQPLDSDSNYAKAMQQWLLQLLQHKMKSSQLLQQNNDNFTDQTHTKSQLNTLTKLINLSLESIRAPEQPTSHNNNGIVPSLLQFPLPSQQNNEEPGSFTLQRNTREDNERGWNISIYLEPANLGPIRFQARIALPEIALSIVAEKTTTVDLIKKTYPMLEQRFQTLGLTPQTLQIRQGKIKKDTPTPATKQGFSIKV